MIGVIKLFVCLDCGEIFEEPMHWEERHGFDYPPYEHWSGCPFCKGDYVKTHKCDCCEEWITDDYVKIKTGERFCSNCFTKIELGEKD